MVAFESTGPYAEPLFHYLRKKPVNLVQMNPMHGKKLRELTGNSPNKTDKKDSRVIADVIAVGHALTLVVPEGAAAELRRLSHARARATKSRTAACNQLQDLIFVIFPEFLSVMKGISTKSAIYLIRNYPDPESIVALGFEALITILKKVSRGKLSEERAEELFEATRNSSGIHKGQRHISKRGRFLMRKLLYFAAINTVRSDGIMHAKYHQMLDRGMS